MTDTDIDSKVVTNVDNYSAEEITSAFTLLTGNVPVDKLRKCYAREYLEAAERYNIHIPDEYFIKWWGVKP